MTTFEIILIIALVLGVIGSNLALLKYSNKFKLPEQTKQHFKQSSETTSEKNDEKSEESTPSNHNNK
ncbi:DUF2897 family protein [Psychrobium sp. 1_MG-2023]|uniref:DUF2897 family protein n=1 Tax=Psychrobium sp. 1_MG-2023 TaxID=3062624 RepID=UPI000C32F97D|nr:DUF2897 family protein [Psychrobium sp. 1_MG-2023]MDP2559966.1 DUF2897 family protein [Psychrobium sp. 1_MG-2023]PKF56368.1 DUF2897 domain-containing protein [Alteromonadales bacterium alter-6D02]